MEEVFVPLIAITTLFIGLPWLVFHYITKWKTAATLSGSDEKLLDELHDMARRLDDRLCSIERIMTAENPNWRQQCLPDQSARLDDQLDRMNESLSSRTLQREPR